MLPTVVSDRKVYVQVDTFEKCTYYKNLKKFRYKNWISFFFISYSSFSNKFIYSFTVVFLEFHVMNGMISLESCL